MCVDECRCDCVPCIVCSLMCVDGCRCDCLPCIICSLRLKPDWDKLIEATASNDKILVADVDCTGAGKPLCDSNGVQGFPTLKYGDPSSLEDYDGGRSYDDIKAHADSLKPLCSPFNLELCEDEDRKKIEDIMALSDDELAAKIEEGEKAMSEAESTFDEELQKLQAQYEALRDTKDSTIKAVKEGGHGLYKSVQASRKSGDKDEV